MLKFFLITGLILFILITVLVVYCCLSVASQADDEMEKYYKQKEKQDFYDKNSDVFR